MKYYFLIFITIFSSIALCQSRDNLSTINVLIDSVVSDINTQIPAQEKVILKSVMPDEYFSLNGSLISRFKSTGREITTENTNSGYNINIIIDKAQVNYTEVFKEKLFGDFKVKRIISLSGNYNILNEGAVFKSDEIDLRNIDTVKYDDIKSLENNSLPYTRGEIPSEPVFSSLLEPVIAISAAALTVILFFTVRSK